jgi:hypothetical protein
MAVCRHTVSRCFRFLEGTLPLEADTLGEHWFNMRALNPVSNVHTLQVLSDVHMNDSLCTKAVTESRFRSETAGKLHPCCSFAVSAAVYRACYSAVPARTFLHPRGVRTEHDQRLRSGIPLV